MLKKRNRLSDPFAKKNALNYSSLFFNVKIFESDAEMPRFALVVSRKISKSAVLRNKTKRSLSKAAENILERIGGAKDIIIIAKKELGPAETERAQGFLEEIFKKAKILK